MGLISKISHFLKKTRKWQGELQSSHFKFPQIRPAKIFTYDQQAFVMHVPIKLTPPLLSHTQWLILEANNLK